MKNRHSFYLRYVLSLFVFLFLLSFITDTGYEQEFPNRSGLKPKLGERLKLTRESSQRIREAVKVQKMNSAWLMENDDIVGTATGVGVDGEPEIRVLTAKAGIRGIPGSLEGFPVKAKVTGRFYALGCPDGPTGRCDRPVPMGVSTGHPSMSAGTIGARVTRDLNGDGVPEGVYALSNNHVYAAINDGSIGDSVIQPGSFDGGRLPADFIGTLSAYEEIKFCTVWWIWLICRETNTIDAAIADVVDPSTGEPLVEAITLSDGYGSPNSVLHPAFGDPKFIDDAGEDLAQLLGQPVQKYGRTTGLTYGTVDSINATINVCYDEACLNVARFVDQIIITPGSFSGGGDSGSLIVTHDDHKYPVGLLFAGSTTDTVANRIDRVLVAFHVDIDSGPAPILESITVDPASSTVVEGQTQQFTATGYYDDSSAADLTQSASWSSSDIAIATIDGTGLATGVSTGTAHITATKDGVTSNGAMLEVLPAPIPTLVSITVDPANATVEEGHTQQFTATGTYNDSSTSDLTQTATWKSSNTNFATINSTGLATGVSEGMVLIKATQGDVTSNEALLQVTAAPSVTLVSITVAPANATVEEGHTQQFTATGTYNDSSTSDLTQTATWKSSNTNFAIIDSSGLATGLSAGSVQITATQDSVISGPATLQVTATTSAGPYLRTGQVLTYSDTWTTVTLDRDYSEMVVVCTPNYDDDLFVGTTMPVVALVRNALGNSFQVKLGQAVGGSIEISEAWVHYMVVEAGVYDLPGVKMEADTFVSTVTDNSRSWVGQSRPYQQSYVNPVVLGQVISYYSELWTVFWCRGSSRSNPPSPNALYVGKHKGEDPRARYNERIGYIVIEAGSGDMDATRYEAAVGSDTIRGVGNSPPYVYSLNGLSFTPSTAIVTQAGMDGGDGSWALLYGDTPPDSLAPDTLYLAVDEDQAWDSERSHTTEQVGYIVFE